MIEKFYRLFLAGEVDSVTMREVNHFIERKLNEIEKLRAQISRDLRRISPDAWHDARAYDTLRNRYKSQWANAKKLAILDIDRRQYCFEQTT